MQHLGTSKVFSISTSCLAAALIIALTGCDSKPQAATKAPATTPASTAQVAAPAATPTAPAPAKDHIMEGGEKVLVRVSTIETPEAVQEFQRNVAILKAQVAAARELKKKVDAATTEKDKKELTKELDAAVTKLNENNQLMAKTYGFSLMRNYQMVVEKSRVFMAVTDEDLEKITKAQANK